MVFLDTHFNHQTWFTTLEASKKFPYTCIFMFMSRDDCVLGWQLAYRETLVTVCNKFYQIHHFCLILGCYHWYVWQSEKKRFVSGNRNSSWFFGPRSKLFPRESHRHCGFLLKWSTWYIQIWIYSTFLHISTPHSHLQCQFRLPNPLTAMEYEINMITRLKLHEVSISINHTNVFFCMWSQWCSSKLWSGVADYVIFLITLYDIVLLWLWSSVIVTKMCQLNMIFFQIIVPNLSHMELSHPCPLCSMLPGDAILCTLWAVEAFQCSHIKEWSIGYDDKS
jgi:hypothetical protein